MTDFLHQIEQLKRYAQHRSSCGVELFPETRSCTCGLDALVAALAEQAEFAVINNPPEPIRSLWLEVLTHPKTADCPDQECMVCSMRDCPDHEPLHYRHDGCPACHQAAPVPHGELPEAVKQISTERMPEDARGVFYSNRDELCEGTPILNGTLSGFNYDQLDPGICSLVRRLREAGFETTDSGDGVSKPAEWYESGDAMRVPNVAAVVAPHCLLTEARRYAAVLGDGWSVEATYFPATDTAVLLGIGGLPVPHDERAPEKE